MSKTKFFYMQEHQNKTFKELGHTQFRDLSSLTTGTRL